MVCLAVAAKIAEIMQIEPYKIKRYKENISPERKEKQYKPRQIRLDIHYRKQRVSIFSQTFKAQRYLNVDSNVCVP